MNDLREIWSLVPPHLDTAGPFALLWAYLLLHLCMGLLLPYRRGAKPFFYLWIEYAGLDLERRLNRQARLPSARFIRGIGVAFVLGACGYLTGYDVQQAARFPYGWIVELLFLSLCINFTAPLKLVREVRRHLQKNETALAVQALAPYFPGALEKADKHIVIRKTIELMIVSLNQFLVAPAFWFLAAGPVGLALYTTFAAMRQAFGFSDERRKAFSRGVKAVDILLKAVPVLLTSTLTVVCMLFVSASSPVRALITVLREVKNGHLSFRLWMIAAMAGGLGITLGGPARFSSGDAEDYPWIGPAQSSARLAPGDLIRASILQYVFIFCVIAALSVFIIMDI